MARLSNSDADPERGVFLLPNGQANMGRMPQSPSGSSTSERTDDTGVYVDETLSTSRDTESSTATPSRPLLVTRTLDNHQHHQHHQHNGGGHNGVSNSIPAFRIPEHNGILSCWKGREHCCCIFGSITFILGAILLTVSLLLFMRAGKSEGSIEPCVSAIRDTESSSSSPSKNLSQKPVMVTETTPTTPTTTFSYDGLVNLAAGLSGQVFQSSTYSDADGMTYPASAAVDGSGNYTLDSGSCSLTDSQLQPFWWIDLQNFKLIKRIRIFKPTDCCHDSLMDAEVRMGQSEELNANPRCQHVTDASDTDVVEVVCKRQIYGRYLSIQMLGTDGNYRSLALCEVELYEH